MPRSLHTRLGADDDTGRCELGEDAGQPGWRPVEVAFHRLAVQVLEALDHEIGRLQIADHVIGAHHPVDVEHDPIRRPTLEREHRFARTGQDPRAVDAQVVALPD